MEAVMLLGTFSISLPRPATASNYMGLQIVNSWLGFYSEHLCRQLRAFPNYFQWIHLGTSGFQSSCRSIWRSADRHKVHRSVGANIPSSISLLCLHLFLAFCTVTSALWCLYSLEDEFCGGWLLLSAQRPRFSSSLILTICTLFLQYTHISMHDSSCGNRYQSINI